VERRPSFLDDQKGEGGIVECVDYLISLVVKHAPAVMTSDLPIEGKPVNWIIRSLPDKNIRFTEVSRTVLFRPFLARIFCSYMNGSEAEGAVYGGFSRLIINSGGHNYSAAFYLGNDALCGFWFKGICIPLDQSDISITKQNV